jgi:ribonuclease HII
VLTDGFPVDGLGVPGLAMWKGDRVAACISAASVLAKVTRDRIMVDLDREHPAYDFKTHKGYVTDVHAAALTAHGPCPQHRMRFVNVRRAAGLEVDLSDPTIEPEPPVEHAPAVELEGRCPEPVDGTTVPSVEELVVSTRVGTRPTRGESA